MEMDTTNDIDDNTFTEPDVQREDWTESQILTPWFVQAYWVSHRDLAMSLPQCCYPGCQQLVVPWALAPVAQEDSEVLVMEWERAPGVVRTWVRPNPHLRPVQNSWEKAQLAREVAQWVEAQVGLKGLKDHGLVDSL